MLSCYVLCYVMLLCYVLCYAVMLCVMLCCYAMCCVMLLCYDMLLCFVIYMLVTNLQTVNLETFPISDQPSLVYCNI